MAVFLRSDKKKKPSHHVDRSAHVDGDGMSASTKRHFDHVKRKMFAFVDRQHRMETDAMRFAAPPPVHHPNIVDQNRAPKIRPHHHTPGPARKQIPLHKQLPHLALATPQAARRGDRSKANGRDKVFANVAFF